MDLIVAVDENWAIGKGNELLFHISEDMKFFRNKTIGKNVICGKKTLLSFPDSKPLPDRHHFVLTSGEFPSCENMTVVHSLDELMEKIKDIPQDDVMLIGGASVYEQLYKLCKRAYVTKIQAKVDDADAFFPNLDNDSDFTLISSSEQLVSKKGIPFSFMTYENQTL